MANQMINKYFLSVIDSKTKSEILSSIAQSYGISEAEAFDEVTDEECEHLLDYLAGSVRLATSVLMQRHSI